MSSNTEEIAAESKERHRVKVLRQYAVLDTPPEQEFDELAAMAAHVCGTPVALISLVDQDRQWFKAKVGQTRSETPRSQSFCAHALDEPEVLVVEDALKDERFAQNPLVQEPSGIRFYAGAPLLSPENATLGTLCVIDKVPRELSSTQKSVLQSLARRVMIKLEDRRQKLKFDVTGRLRPGVHDFTLEELRTLVCVNSYRSTLWLQLLSFLGTPIISKVFSHAYFEGGLVSTADRPSSTTVTLAVKEPYVVRSTPVLEHYFSIGTEEILQMYSVKLNFWFECPSPEPFPHQKFFNLTPAWRNEPLSSGFIRINLNSPDVITQFRDGLDPFGSLS
jgi:GAF domain